MRAFRRTSGSALLPLHSPTVFATIRDQERPLVDPDSDPYTRTKSVRVTTR